MERPRGDRSGPDRGRRQVREPPRRLSIRDGGANHGGIHHGADVRIDWIASDDLGGDATEEALGEADGILILGGFGIRGVEGKVDAVRFARERGVPSSGSASPVRAVIEFARHVCGLEDANSSEFAPGTPHLVIDLLPSRRT